MLVITNIKKIKIFFSHTRGYFSGTLELTKFIGIKCMIFTVLCGSNMLELWWNFWNFEKYKKIIKKLEIFKEIIYIGNVDIKCRN